MKSGLGRKVVFLYCGINGNGQLYEEYTSADIQKYAAIGHDGQGTAGDGADEFVITPSNNFSGSLEYPDGIIAIMVRLMNTIISINSNYRVWFGVGSEPTPPFGPYKDPHDPNQGRYPANATEYAAHYTDVGNKIIAFVEALRTAVGDTAWFNYVYGIYINNEHVADSIDGGRPITKTDAGLRSHPQINMYDRVSTYVKSSANGWKMMLWSPYYGYGGNTLETIESIGWIANRTNIFDIVLIQPSHYFAPVPSKANIEAVRQSVYLQKVTYRNNGDGTFGIVAGSKNSNTQIGCQMEIDKDYYTTKTVLYDDYVRIFTNNSGQPGDPLPIQPSFYKNHYPFSFYCDAKYDEPYHFDEICGEVADFHGNDPL